MRELFDIRDRVVAVAGAAGAFGSEIARELAARGCHLSLLDINEAGLEKIVSELPESAQVHTRVFNAIEEDECESALDECAQRWSRIDGFVNCVGAFKIIAAEDMTRRDFTQVLETNVSAALSMCKFAARHMIPRRYGRIINIASVSDSVVNPGYAAYAASKSALTHLTRVLAVEWAPHSITVNAISPAMCETALTTDFLARSDNRATAKSKILLDRLLEPEDILGTVVLLLSPGGGFITGQAIHVDGGRTIS